MPNGQDVRPLHLPKAAIADLVELAGVSDDISAIIEASIGELPAASIDGISARLASKANVDFSIVQTVVTALWNIKNLQRRFGISDGEKLVEQLSRVLKSELEQEDFATWQDGMNQIAAALDAMTEDHPITISIKASGLAYAHQHLMINARLITDVRPVFDVSGENIVETVIAHTLALEYTDYFEKKMITFALDSQDVISLRSQCERAERKARATLEALQRADLNPILIPENADDQT